MTVRQKILKAIYPLFVFVQQLSSKKKIHENRKGASPPVSFYGLSVQLNNGRILSLSELKGKKVLLVNTASDCGYTNQYAELQQLYENNRDRLEILAFPANDFKEQEKASDEEIATFCAVNYGVSFPLAKKSSVIRSADQNPVFRWLSHKDQNGWLDHPPRWNFSKYLVSEDGVLTHQFDPAVSPLGEEFSRALDAQPNSR